MKSIRDIYKIGKGPSSSHTMGPERAARLFKEKYPNADSYRVYLYGSLSKTGVGHGTDRVIREVLSPIPTEIVFSDLTIPDSHPNTMDLICLIGGEETGRLRVESIGGGDIRLAGNSAAVSAAEVYPHNTMAEIMQYCKDHQLPRLSDYVEKFEDEAIWEYLAEVWDAMKQAIENGLRSDGILPGGLNVQKRAKKLYELQPPEETPQLWECRILSAYAFAVSEQNADNGTVVTAPTCGACGVLPASLRYIQQTRNLTDEQILRGLATAGLIGALTKHNASVSGAECGCQAEIGTACAMAASGLAEMFGNTLEQVEYAAEVAMEHHLGLTCDPICGLVQIPCIERNAVAALRALNACNLSYFLSDSRNISYDMVCKAMYETGLNLSHMYKETSEGGLARVYPTRLEKMVAELPKNKN
ncbi:MAG: L-serine ammonia-lyase, iron-sulfur-dependent, subunit alpha [Oscillospiraceae bacterium]|nr:L-serine ammonia-lyase, iron-sulfur-dependent, subunit alpha [Oscillospiraceae bacterium]